jgi:hypothetical protein
VAQASEQALETEIERLRNALGDEPPRSVERKIRRRLDDLESQLFRLRDLAQRRKLFGW